MGAFRKETGADVDEELRFHVETLVERHMAEGMTEEDARRKVMARFRDLGGTRTALLREREKEAITVQRRLFFDGLRQDLRVSWRQYWKRPGFTAAAVTTLALGIGATVAIFSVVNGVLLNPLPYPEPDHLVKLWNVDTRSGARSDWMDHPDIRYWHAEVPGLKVAGYASTRVTLTGIGEPTVIFGAAVTNGLLDVFGLKPALGRDVTAAEDVPGGPNVVMVSYGFWRERLGGSPDALGRTLQFDGESWEVVGVAPEGFDFPEHARFWIPQHQDEAQCGHGCRNIRAVGRIERGTTLAAVQERMDAAEARLVRTYPDVHRDDSVTFQPILAAMVANVRVALWVLLGAVGMVLLVACANVANLLLVRATDRIGEMALRATLGAQRSRIIRQLLTESLLLSLGGGALGLLLARWGISATVHLAPDGIPRLQEAGLDGRVVGFAFVLVVVTTVIFGLAPALHMARRPLGAALGTSRRTSGGKGTDLSRSLLLSGEVALSLMLLLGAGLLFGTLRSIRSQDLGFATQHVERFHLALPRSRYDVDAGTRFFEQLEDRLDALPELAVAGSSLNAPLSGGHISSPLTFPDRPPVDRADEPSIRVRPATVGYLEAMDIPLQRGRWFTRGDRRDNTGVVVLNQAAVRRFFHDQNPIGRPIQLHITWGFDEEPVRTVVGVVGDTRSSSATEPDVPAAYVPEAQFGVDNLYVTMRLAPGARTALPAARAILKNMDPYLAVTDMERIEDVLRRELAPTRFYLTLVGVFSVLALVLAAVGLYGVVAYSVSRRTREIGIRVALGAHGGDVVGMALRDGVIPALAGVVVGIGGSLLGGRVLQSLLYGVEPQDPKTLATVTAVLLAVVFLATFVPARRASRIQPLAALRME